MNQRLSPSDRTRRRSAKRKGAVLLVLSLWLTGIGMLAHRQYTKTDAQRLAEAVTMLAPAQYYYQVFRNDVQLGVMLSRLDTAESGWIASTIYQGLSDPNPIKLDPPELLSRSRAYLSRGFVLDSFSIATDPQLTNARALRNDRMARFQMMPELGTLTPTLAPIALMLTHTPRPGAQAIYPIFNTRSQLTRKVTWRVDAESLFTIADSSRYDSAATQWVAAHTDTVRAWRIVRPPSRAIALWVDAQGRMVSAEDSAGLRVTRTAYEIAFTNWRHAHR